MARQEHSIEEVLTLPNEKYYDYLRQNLSNAKQRIWLNLFKVDLDPNFDEELKVRNLVNILIDRYKKGIEVKILMATSRSIPSLLISQLTAYDYFIKKGLHAKLFKSNNKNIQGSHSKYIIIDDTDIILGTHNWTFNGFSKNLEDSIAIKSTELNKELANEFNKDWKASWNLEQFKTNFTLNKRIFQISRQLRLEKKTI